VTIKVYERNTPQATRELEIHRRLKVAASDHAGSRLVRTLLDSFSVEGSGGSHVCLIHKPLGMSLAALRAKFKDRKLPKDLLKVSLIHLFYALDYLHTEVGVVHAGIASSPPSGCLQDADLIIQTYKKTICF